jgi:NTE family protein
MNPLNLNPLRDIMESLVDFERLRRCDRVKIFISATNVRSGRVKVFRHDELCPEAILASACLPQLFQAVRIGDDIYWDGGYLGNPVLYPFFYRCTSPDVLIVQINPFTREHEPTTPVEIMDRLNEITFNSSLLAEFRALNFVAQLVEQGRVDSTRYKRVLPHIISGAEVLGQFTVSSKFNAHWGFLTLLRDAGRATAQDWLDRNIEHVGVRPTVDVREYYLSPDR